ncbi:TcdA/TcdB pore-forming domain-containing protein [Pseudomonas parakoreensis]
MQALEAKSTAGSLLLNTDNHSMLVSKVVTQGETSYRFYDPNFGLYAFARIEALQQGVQRFVQEESIARLYGLEQAAASIFEVIELDGANIAGHSLPSDIRVEHLLSGDPLGGGRAVEPWSQHAALRARSLSENARLGQALSSVDSHKWVRTIESATLRLQDQHQLSRDFVPVFESLKSAAQGRSEITLVSASDPQRTRTVQTDDPRLSGIKSYLSDTFEALSGRRAGSAVIDPTDAGAVHTLNAGFAIQALLLGLQSAESGMGATALTSAVRIHGYLAYAQMAHGLVVDAAQLLNLVRHAFSDGLRVAKTTSSIVSNALGNVLNDGVGSVLQLASIGFDIYLLVNAQDDIQRAVYATQLAFDAGGLALGVGALGAGIVGAGTAAAFLGGAGVILGGWRWASARWSRASVPGPNVGSGSAGISMMCMRPIDRKAIRYRAIATLPIRVRSTPALICATDSLPSAATKFSPRKTTTLCKSPGSSGIAARPSAFERLSTFATRFPSIRRRVLKASCCRVCRSASWASSMKVCLLRQRSEKTWKRRWLWKNTSGQASSNSGSAFTRHRPNTSWKKWCPTTWKPMSAWRLAPISVFCTSPIAAGGARLP